MVADELRPVRIKSVRLCICASVCVCVRSPWLKVSRLCQSGPFGPGRHLLLGSVRRPARPCGLAWLGGLGLRAP
eukprot:9003530-Alexandrium_andersonii.AAC.1